MIHCKSCGSDQGKSCPVCGAGCGADMQGKQYLTWGDLHSHISHMRAEELDQTATIQLAYDEFVVIQGLGQSKDGILDHGHHYLVPLGVGISLG